MSESSPEPLDPGPPGPLPYRLLEHTSDIKIEIYGSDLAELFTNAVICLFDIILDRDTVRETVRQPVYLEDESLSELFLDWLRELLFLFSTRSLAVARVEINAIHCNLQTATCKLQALTPKAPVEAPPQVPVEVAAKVTLSATLFGEEFDQERHGLKVEVKTPTYHQYQIDKTDEGYRATVILDV